MSRQPPRYNLFNQAESRHIMQRDLVISCLSHCNHLQYIVEFDKTIVSKKVGTFGPLAHWKVPLIVSGRRLEMRNSGRFQRDRRSLEMITES